MALCDAGVAPDILAVAIRDVIAARDELPTVAKLLAYCRDAETRELSRSWVCPECGSELVAVLNNSPVLCFDCDWQPGQDEEPEP